MNEINKDLLVNILQYIGAGSKGYINYTKKKWDSGEYFKQIWTTRSLSNIKAKEVLVNLNDADVRNNIVLVQQLIDAKVLTNLEMKEEDGSETLLFLTPTGVELLYQLEQTIENQINYDKIHQLIQVSNQNFFNNYVNVTISRLQEPLLDQDAMSAKSSLFCLFLILSGSIRKNNAFIILKQENDGEIEFQKDIVEYLNILSARIYKFSFVPKSSKGQKLSKYFSEGDLSNFFRRNKEIRTAYAETFKNEKELLYFDAYNNNELDLKIFAKVINITIKRLNHFADEDDEVMDNILDTIKLFYLNNPIKQAHLKSLFVGVPDYEYYSILETVAMQEIDNLAEE